MVVFMSLIAQGHNGVETGGFDGGPQAEEEANTDRDNKARDHRPEGNCGRQSRNEGSDKETHRIAEQNPQYSTQAGKAHGLEQELPGDIAAASANGFAHADLP